MSFDVRKDRVLGTLVDSNWDADFVPFIGAWLSTQSDKRLPDTQMLADWFTEKGDLKDYHGAGMTPPDLAEIAHAVEIVCDDNPKELMLKKYFRLGESIDFGNKTTPHHKLAKLELPLYITTNYDDLMYMALKQNGKKPKRYISPWYRTESFDPREEEPFNEADYEPSPQQPLVVHLHGHQTISESLVLTKNDYINFMTAYAENPERVLHFAILAMLIQSPLLFIGYSLNDINLSVIFRSIFQRLPVDTGSTWYTVQPPTNQLDNPGKTPIPPEQKTFMNKYFKSLFRTEVVWEDGCDFLTELYSLHKTKPQYGGAK